MPSRSRHRKRRKSKTGARNRGDYGFARARDLAFDAVQSLWRRRSNAGMKQTDIARALDREPAWVNRSLRGPGNWTLRTFGELIEALNGEIEIKVYAIEDALAPAPNYHAYVDYEPVYTTIVRMPQGSPVPSSVIPSSTTTGIQNLFGEKTLAATGS
jgi:hypothetical protein